MKPEFANANVRACCPDCNGALTTFEISYGGKELKLTTEKCQCVILPNGKIAAAENNTGRLTRWISKFIDKRKP